MKHSAAAFAYAGVAATLALLPFLRSYFDHKSVPVYISLLALAETSSPLPENSLWIGAAASLSLVV